VLQQHRSIVRKDLTIGFPGRANVLFFLAEVIDSQGIVIGPSRQRRGFPALDPLSRVVQSSRKFPSFTKQQVAVGGGMTRTFRRSIGVGREAARSAVP